MLEIDDNVLCDAFFSQCINLSKLSFEIKLFELG